MPDNKLLAAKKKIDTKIATKVGEPVPTSANTPLTTEQLEKFANWIPEGNTIDLAKDLSKRGLINADQLVTSASQELTSSPNLAKQGAAGNIVDVANIQKQQGMWKQAALKEMLAKARAKGIRTPLEVMANKEYLTGGKYKSGLNDPKFNEIHPNFMTVFSNLLNDRYAAEAADNQAKVASAAPVMASK